MFHAHIVSVS